MKKINLTFVILILGTQVFAAAKEVSPIPSDPTIGLTITELLICALLLFAMVMLFATVMIFKAFKVMVNAKNDQTEHTETEIAKPLDYVEWAKLKRTKPNIWTKLLSLKPIEEEEDLIIPHAYDEIHELNNPIPKWFNVLFYGSVLIAAGYLYYYHVADGPKQDQEYTTEMEAAAKAKRIFLAKFAEKFDENSVKVDPALIENGKLVFKTNCVACHGEQAQGTVGPNLTDEFWLHGGSVNDIFKTVKYGVPAKGMTSWEKNLTSKNIAEVVNFIMSLKGSRPANAKAPQGEKYEAKAVSDTLKNETIAKK